MLFKLKRGAGIIKVALLIIFCALFIVLITGCTKDNDNKVEEESNKKDLKYTKAVFERNNNIYLYDEEQQQLQPIGDTTRFKELMVLNPDKKRIAYKYSYEENNPAIEVIIYNIAKNKYDTINIADEELKNIIELKWINKDKIMIIATLNPSVLKYGIYDVNTKQLINSAKGLLMETLNNGELLLYSKTSRSSEKEKSNLYLGNKLLFEVDNTEEEIQFAKISNDKKQIAFTAMIYDLENGGVKEFLYTGKLDFDKASVSSIKKIAIPSNIVGEPYFDKENKLFIKNEEDTYKIDGTFFSLIETKEEEVVGPSPEQLTGLKKLLKNTFVDEFIEDYLQLDELQIYNIQWF